MSELASGSKMSVAVMNAKTVYIGAVAPTTKYDGMLWMDISTDPPVVKVYDLTNAQWMEYRPVYYEIPTGAWADPTTANIGNGTLVVVYNSTQAGTRLYARSNGAWVNIGGTLSRVYPVSDNEQDSLTDSTEGATDIFGYAVTAFLASETITLKTITVTPTETESTVTGFAAICAARGVAPLTFTAKLYINNVLVDSEDFTVNEWMGLKGSQDGIDAAVSVELRVTETSGNAGNLDVGGMYVAGIAVVT